MFQRRNDPGFFHQARQFIWPKMGLWRLVKYYRYRIVRLSSTTHTIAANLAAGSAMSFTPFFGVHFLGALLIARLVHAKMNIIAAIVGTLIGNPWTFPFFMVGSYGFGAFILSLFGVSFSETGLSHETIAQNSDGFWSYLFNNFWDLYIPTALGGTLIAFITFPVFYILYFYIVKSAQRARRLRLKRKQRKQFNKSSRGHKKK